MNLTIHYIFIGKLLHFLTDKLHKLYRFYPLSWVIKAEDEKVLKGFTKAHFKHTMENMLGDFSTLPIKEVDLAQQQEIIADANLILEHTFDLLGSGKVTLNPIDWHTDFKSGFTWDKGTFYKQYRTVDLNNDSDVKVPWELSRSHQLLYLGEAYLLTKDERYANEIIFQINNWIDENPFLYSINWTCAMDVSIRAINWMYAVNMIMESELVTDAFITKMMKSMYQHGWHVFHNLEKGFPYSANHYASNVVGLVFLGKLLHGTAKGKTWFEFGRSEYYKEVREQVLPSGVHFERSTSYHRLTTELFSYTYFLLKRTNEQIPFDVEYRIKSMFGFVLYYMKPTGISPLLGDNDDGRLLPFVKSSLLNHSYLLCLDAIAFKNSISKSASGRFSIDAFFLLGADALEQYNNQISNASSLQPFSFADAGIHVIRNQEFYLCINNSGVSRYGNGNKRTVSTHTHADLLSYELAIGNTSFLVDPGTNVYTSSAKSRNQFRGTAKHNTVCVENQNQYTIPENDLFSIADNVNQVDEGLSFNGDTVTYKGGYTTNLKEGINYSHHRTFSFNKETKQCVLFDQLSGLQQSKVESYSHFDAGVNVKIMDDTCVVAEKDGVSITMHFECITPFSLALVDDTVSPSYGKIEPAKTLMFTAIGQEVFQFKTIITLT
jgi:hypothetical protein